MKRRVRKVKSVKGGFGEADLRKNRGSSRFLANQGEPVGGSP